MVKKENPSAQPGCYRGNPLSALYMDSWYGQGDACVRLVGLGITLSHTIKDHFSPSPPTQFSSFFSRDINSHDSTNQSTLLVAQACLPHFTFQLSLKTFF